MNDFEKYYKIKFTPDELLLLRTALFTTVNELPSYFNITSKYDIVPAVHSSDEENNLYLTEAMIWHLSCGLCAFTEFNIIRKYITNDSVNKLYSKMFHIDTDKNKNIDFTLNHDYSKNVRNKTVFELYIDEQDLTLIKIISNHFRPLIVSNKYCLYHYIVGFLNMINNTTYNGYIRLNWIYFDILNMLIRYCISDMTCVDYKDYKIADRIFVDANIDYSEYKRFIKQYSSILARLNYNTIKIMEIDENNEL